MLLAFLEGRTFALVMGPPILVISTVTGTLISKFT